MFAILNLAEVCLAVLCSITGQQLTARKVKDKMDVRKILALEVSFPAYVSVLCGLAGVWSFLKARMVILKFLLLKQ